MHYEMICNNQTNDRMYLNMSCGNQRVAKQKKRLKETVKKIN